MLFDDSAIRRMVQVSIMQVVDMVAMNDGRMPTTFAMNVRMIGMRMTHLLSFLKPMGSKSTALLEHIIDRLNLPN